jgi:hypothetical protein
MTVRWPAAAGLSLLDPRLLWATIALVAALLIGAAVIAWADRWRKKVDRSVLSPGEQLAAFRLSYERGELSQEEYERIRARLAPKIRESNLGTRDSAAGGHARPDGSVAPPIDPSAPKPETRNPNSDPPSDGPQQTA